MYMYMHTYTHTYNTYLYVYAHILITHTYTRNMYICNVHIHAIPAGDATTLTPYWYSLPCVGAIPQHNMVMGDDAPK